MHTRQIVPDAIKGLAIVLMVYGHITHVGSFSIYQKELVGIIYTFHMPIFLIVSGFFYNHRNDPLVTVKKITSRILRPYLIFAPLYLIGLSWIQSTGIQTSTIPPSSFLDFFEILLFYPRGPYWFIHSLFLIQLSLILVKTLTNRLQMRESLTLVIALFVLALLCSVGLLKPRTVVFFLMGMALAYSGRVVPDSIWAGFIMMIIIFVITRGELMEFSLMQVAWCLSILVFMSGIFHSYESHSIVNIFGWLGRNSLVILVLHSFFIILCKLFSSLLLKLDQTGGFYSFTVVFITILGCILAAQFLDRFQISRFIFGTNKIYSSQYAGESNVLGK